MSQELCSLNLPNAGVPACDKTRGIPRYLIIGDKEFTAGEFADIPSWKAAFKAATLVGRSQVGKLIVLPIIADVANTTEANKEGTLNQGFKEVLREGFPSFNFGCQISNNHAQKLRPLNGQDVKCMTVDDNLNVWGTYTSAAKFRGESAKIFIGGDNFSDGQNSKTILINVAFTDVLEFKMNSRYFTIDFAVSDFGKLKDVDLTDAGGSAAGVRHITGKIKTGKVGVKLDIYADYAAVMANVARWTVSADDGSVISVFSVAQNAGGYWVVTLTAGEYAAIGVGVILRLNFAAPSVLDAAGATGIEGVEITWAHA